MIERGLFSDIVWPESGPISANLYGSGLGYERIFFACNTSQLDIVGRCFAISLPVCPVVVLFRFVHCFKRVARHGEQPAVADALGLTRFALQ